MNFTICAIIEHHDLKMMKDDFPILYTQIHSMKCSPVAVPSSVPFETKQKQFPISDVRLTFLLPALRFHLQTDYRAHHENRHHHPSCC
jgi:hypothetical protein